MFDHAEEIQTVDPEVIGLYPADVAAVISAYTACDPGSGPCRPDD